MPARRAGRLRGATTSTTAPSRGLSHKSVRHPELAGLSEHTGLELVGRQLPGHSRQICPGLPARRVRTAGTNDPVGRISVEECMFPRIWRPTIRLLGYALILQPGFCHRRSLCPRSGARCGRSSVRKCHIPPLFIGPYGAGDTSDAPDALMAAAKSPVTSKPRCSTKPRPNASPN
jgi:hypothetical protein